MKLHVVKIDLNTAQVYASALVESMADRYLIQEGIFTHNPNFDLTGRDEEAVEEKCKNLIFKCI